jgi:hypothetical protein
MIMTSATRPETLQRARSMARETLSGSASFREMQLEDQQKIYKEVVRENLAKLARTSSNGNGSRLAGAMVKDFKKFDPGFDKSVNAFEDLVDSVDFPKFVGDLLKSVFDANINVMKRQTDDYIRLLREATKVTADFIKSVNEEDAFAYLVESPGSKFGMTMKEGEDGSKEMVLTTPDGEPVDVEDNEVKKAIVDAKINIAKEHRAALREVLLMGVTRIVVDKGEVEAGVEFKITAKRLSADTMSNTNTNVNTVSGSYGGGLSGLFGGPSLRFENVNTNINVVTSKQTAEDELAATLRGKVNIKFKSDYFKLDNFAQMYGAGGVAALPGAQPQPLPAPAS